MKIFIYFFLVILSVTDITANAGDSLYQADFVVSADGSGNFKTLSEAIVAVPDFCDRETVVFLERQLSLMLLILLLQKTLRLRIRRNLL